MLQRACGGVVSKGSLSTTAAGGVAGHNVDGPASFCTAQTLLGNHVTVRVYIYEALPVIYIRGSASPFGVEALRDTRAGYEQAGRAKSGALLEAWTDWMILSRYSAGTVWLL